MLKYTHIFLMKVFMTDKFRTLPYTDWRTRQNMLYKFIFLASERITSPEPRVEGENPFLNVVF